MKKLIFILSFFLFGQYAIAGSIKIPIQSDSVELEKLKIYDKDFIQYKRLAFNTDRAEYAPSFYSNGIVFSKSKTRLTDFSKTSKIRRKHKSKLYFSSLDVDFREAAPLKVKGKNKLGVSQASFQNPSKTVYYTALGSTNGTVLNKKHFGVYSAKYNSFDNLWSNYTAFTHNGTYYSNITPCINKTGDKLFFSSNMSDGFGGMDIYVSEWKNNEWTEPVNLGKEVNTKGDEMYAFIFEDSLIYFASNGHLGLGGLDIFKYNMYTRKRINLGAPYNSAFDDFGYIRSTKVNNGYFSSNRSDNGTNTDIYAFKSIRPKPREIQLNILDASTGSAVKEVKLNMSSSLSKEVELYVLMDGQLRGMKFEIGEPYKIYVVKQGFISKMMTVVFKKTDIEFNILIDKDTLLDSTNVIVEEKMVISNNTFKSKVKNFIDQKFKSTKNKLTTSDSTAENSYHKFNTIYFDFNKYDLKAESKKVLDEVLTSLNNQPTLKVEINSYTDSRGSKEYNLTLSKKRANATSRYLIKNGIQKNRIKANGRGELNPIVKCTKKCSEKEHSKNRRTEIILK